MEAEVQPERYFVLQGKCSTLLTDSGETYTFYGVDGMPEMCSFSHIPRREDEMQGKSTLFSK
jgi:hypothetical protein